MAQPKVLDVGNCDHDHGNIRRMLTTQFNANVAQAHAASDTLEKLRNEQFDLVLINRQLDHDFSSGLEVLKQIKQDDVLADTPVMLITNYAEHQDTAVALGALRGFGKRELNSEETRLKLSTVLAAAEK
jgi:CheY-like chemotaxis protein